MSVTRYQLDRHSVDYIRAQRSEGETLAHKLLETIRFETGVTSAFLSRNLSIDQVSDLYSVEIAFRKESNDVLAKLILRYLGSADRIVVIENPNARPNDPFISNVPYVVYNGLEVLHPLTLASSLLEILNVIEKSHSYPFIGIMTGLTNPDVFKEGTVDTQSLDELVENCKHIFVGAYDNEADVFWSQSVSQIEALSAEMI